MRRVISVLKANENAVESSLTSLRSFTNYAFSSLQDAPTANLSGAISLSVKAPATPKSAVEVKASAGGASASTKYTLADLRKLQAEPTELKDVARVSVLHSSLMDHLVRLTHERFSILAQYPDFTTMYGKDFYYRAHPEDLKKFYDMVDEFHRMYDVVTEFDSLSTLATEMVPSARSRRMNTIHPAVGPNLANGAVTQFLL